MAIKEFTEKEIEEKVKECIEKAVKSISFEERRKKTEEEIQKLRKSLRRSLDISSLNKVFNI